MNRARIFALGFCLILVSVGCSRQDSDAISKIARKLFDRTQAATEEAREKLDMPWKGAGKDAPLRERIQARLRWENTLADQAIEVVVREKEVELQGTVKTALQKQRAFELAAATTGVDNVQDSLKVAEE
jgi:osmotically-inducible protein OsmY